ncbi:hypothetical protein [Nonomuraea rubra]|uniref:hypothetical protein n=1 Tax=Nonomuraea rubra TaxID=46180 RepID=UPI0033E77CE5
MIKLLTRITRRPPEAAPAAAADEADTLVLPALPALPPAEALFGDAEASEARRLAIEERRKLREAEVADQLAEAEAAAKLAAVAHKAELERQRREQKLADDRARAAEATRRAELDAEAVKRAEASSKRRIKIAQTTERARRLAVNIVANIGAGYGQAAYMAAHLAVPLLVAVMLAAALELIAVTTLDYGLTARKQGRPYKLKIAAAALLAGVVAWLNYSHWILTPKQQGLAIPVALLSLLCPLLWAWYHAARDAETANVRDLAGGAARSRTGSKIASREAASTDIKIAEFTRGQWLMWPRQTLAAKRAAIRYRITDPDAAYRAAEQQAAAKEAARRSKINPKARAIKEAEARAAAAETRLTEIEARQIDAERTAAELRERLLATQAALDTAQRRELDPPVATPMRYLPTTAEVAAMSDAEKRDSAEDAYRTARAENVDIPGTLLGTHYGMSESWGRDRRRRVKHLMRMDLDDELDDEADAAANGG